MVSQYIYIWHNFDTNTTKYILYYSLWLNHSLDCQRLRTSLCGSGTKIISRIWRRSLRMIWLREQHQLWLIAFFLIRQSFENTEYISPFADTRKISGYDSACRVFVRVRSWYSERFWCGVRYFVNFEKYFFDAFPNGDWPRSPKWDGLS